MEPNAYFFQILIFGQFCLPFLILLLKEKGRFVSLVQIFTSLVFLIFLFQINNGFYKGEFLYVIGKTDIFMGIELKFDNLSHVFMLSASIVFSSVLIFLFSKKTKWEFYFLFNLLFSDLFLLFMCNDLFNFYVALELLSLLSYLLISFEMKNLQFWASLKYMLLGAVGFNLYLLGTALIYKQTGTLNLSLLRTFRNISLFPQVLIITSLLIKSGVFLFSMWLPSAHSEAPTAVSAILSGIIVKGGLFFIFRLSSVFESPFIFMYAEIAGYVTAVFGVIFALLQKDIKLILAFHTMSQVGYILVGIKSYGILYSFSHSIFKTLLFLSAGIMASLFGSRKLENIKKSQVKIPLLLFIPISIGYFSISGLPFFTGSWEKHHIISELPIIGNIILILVAVGTVASIGKIFFTVLRKIEYKFYFKPEYFSLFLLSFFSLFFGIVKTLDTFTFSGSFLEPSIVFLFGIIFYKIAASKFRVFYPAELFKLQNVLKGFFIILAFILFFSKIGGV